jgi:deazaflavin-dependent oxidoreductase (nitroreductase family)
MWFNPIMKWLLRSPFHGTIDKSTLVIRYRGRKSGKVYETPVNYVQDGNNLIITSYRQRTWWRNLMGGASADVILKGKERHGTAEAYHQDEDVAHYLSVYLQKLPQYAKYFQVNLDHEGLPDQNEVRRAARERVIVRVQLAV